MIVSDDCEGKMKTRTAPLTKRPVIRLLVIWIIQTLALIIMALLMDSVFVESIGVAIVVTAVIGLLNQLVKGWLKGVQCKP